MRYNIGALKYFYLTSDFVDMLKKNEFYYFSNRAVLSK